jgi:hypothetical protein
MNLSFNAAFTHKVQRAHTSQAQDIGDVTEVRRSASPLDFGPRP